MGFGRSVVFLPAKNGEIDIPMNCVNGHPATPISSHFSRSVKLWQNTTSAALSYNECSRNLRLTAPDDDQVTFLLAKSPFESNEAIFFLLRQVSPYLLLGSDVDHLNSRAELSLVLLLVRNQYQMRIEVTRSLLFVTILDGTVLRTSFRIGAQRRGNPVVRPDLISPRKLVPSCGLMMPA